MKTDILHVRQYRSKIINFIKFTNQVKRPFKTISTDSLFQKLSDLPFNMHSYLSEMHCFTTATTTTTVLLQIFNCLNGMV